MSNLLIRRKALEGVAKGRLPSGYTEVEYIQSTGKPSTQYINTGIKAKSTLKAEYDTQRELNYQNGAFFGTFESPYWGERYVNGTYQLMFNGFSNGGSPDFNRHTIVLENAQFYIDGVSIIQRTATAFTSNSDIYVMAASGSGEMFSQKAYRFKLYDNNVLIMSLVPCINPSNEVGMYDIVNRRFLGNSGTGTFIAGDPV